jgi:hypothetical protein
VTLVEKEVDMTSFSPRRAALGAVLAVCGLGMATPVLADHWHGHHYYHHGYYRGYGYGYGGPIYAPGYYAPPPVYYPSPGINVVVPLRFGRHW